LGDTSAHHYHSDSPPAEIDKNASGDSGHSNPHQHTGGNARSHTGGNAMKAWLRYFIPKPRWQNVPRVLVERLDSRGAGQEELLLIKSGRARNIQHAKELMMRYGASTAVECLKLMPPPRRVTFLERLYRLFLKIAGHDERNVYRKSSDRIGVKFRFKDD
jgi:hypothetical protein